MSKQNFAWSPTQNAFFPLDMREEYEAAGTWPSDAVEVDDAVFEAYGIASAPEGKVRGADTTGMPAWIDVPPPTAAEVRRERDALLSASDWTQLPDVPQETKALWAPYRQALRDLPEQPGFPADVEFPDPPA